MSIERFTNGEFDIELIPAGDSFRVAAPGLARGLAYGSAKDMLRSVPDEEKGWAVLPTPGGEQQGWYVTEPGMYRTIGQRQASKIRRPEARAQVERFQRWIFHDVLPSLRRHGSYAMANAEIHGSLPTTLSWEDAAAIGRSHHGLGMNVTQWRRMLAAGSVLKDNGKPRVKYEDLFWPTDTRWEIHAHAVQFLVGVAIVNARRMQEKARNVQMLIEIEGVGRELPGAGEDR